MPAYARNKKTRWAVRVADRVSAFAITVGGISTILAVSAVFAFLVSVAIPLFAPGKAKPVAASAPLATPGIQHLGADEYRLIGWTLAQDGVLRAFNLVTGDSVETRVLVPADSVVASAYDAATASLAVARSNGSVLVVQLSWSTDFPDSNSLAADVRSLAVGATAPDTTGVVERTHDGFRRQRLVIEPAADVPALTTGVLRTLDVMRDGDAYVLAGAVADTLHFCRVERAENEFTGEVVLSLERGAVATSGTIERVLIAEAGTVIYAVDSAGMASAFDMRDLASPRAVARAQLVPAGTRVTALAPLIGRTTLLVGASDGSVSTWFRYTPVGGDTSAIGCSRRFEGDDDAAVVSVQGSVRGRIAVVAAANGRVRVLQTTSGEKAVDLEVSAEGVTDAVFAPKDDGLIVLARDGLHQYDLNLRHPEVTLRSLFFPVWYEGYPRPEHVWQSSAGTDDFEAKLGLWPLVFGTLKATLYSLLFGVPLALLAAIFTSEFVSPSFRPRLKTLIESMASLPSVVLGFLAALVIAPFVQRTVPSVVAAFVLVPVVLLTCAAIWQLLPAELSRRLARWRLLFILASMPVAVGLAAVAGPLAERRLFGGDMMAWLAGGRGGAFGGWWILMLPLSGAAVIYALTRFTGPRIRLLATRSTRARVAGVDLARFAVGGVAIVALSALIAMILTALGADPRGGVVGTYVQRNALVVGFVMGFAIIPIIYTIAEDALSAVPQHLRAASLGAGATPWQTAMRIVLPTAMSGLFSAIMIGLGRAVGETMIVLMAAGNTPVLEMNVFNGFRTLSANIAVELPEAVRDSTHYRTLFLAALILFMMTFVVNTVAEVVRIRFRKRSAQI